MSLRRRYLFFIFLLFVPCTFSLEGPYEIEHGKYFTIKVTTSPEYQRQVYYSSMILCQNLTCDIYFMNDKEFEELEKTHIVPNVTEKYLDQKELYVKKFRVDKGLLHIVVNNKFPNKTNIITMYYELQTHYPWYWFSEYGWALILGGIAVFSLIPFAMSCALTCYLLVVKQKYEKQLGESSPLLPGKNNIPKAYVINLKKDYTNKEETEDTKKENVKIDKCIICKTNPPNVKLYDCQHVPFCSKCDVPNFDSACPICGSSISKIKIM